MSRPWTTTEVKFLRAHAGDGARAIACALERSVVSVKKAAQRHRVSLRPSGCRTGTVLGQPRGVSLRPEVRATLAVDGTLINERLRIDAQAELCPSCGRRPQRVRATGLCRPCHLDRLAEAHRERQAELAAQRDLWRERQALKRQRDAAETTS
jgi:hypothetical protein